MAATYFRRWVVLEGVTHELNPWRSTAERFVALCGRRLPLESVLLRRPPSPGPDGRPVLCRLCAAAPAGPPGTPRDDRSADSRHLVSALLGAAHGLSGPWHVVRRHRPRRR
jgi:hypothetical protein